MKTMRAILHTAGKSDKEILKTGGAVMRKDIPMIRAYFDAWDGIEAIVSEESLTMLKTSDAPCRYNLIGWDEKDDQTDAKVREAIYLMEQDPIFGTYQDDRETFDFVWDEKEYEPAGGISFEAADVEILEDNNAQNLARLIFQNPTLPVIPMVDYEICAGDECQYWAGSIGAARVRQYIYDDEGLGTGETILYRSEASKLVDGMVEKHEDPNEYETARQQAWDRVRSMSWEKAIFVNIELPE